LFGLSNPYVTRGTSFVDDSESLGSLYAVESKRPPVAAVSMMISQFLGLFPLSKPCVTRGRSFVDDF